MSALSVPNLGGRSAGLLAAAAGITLVGAGATVLTLRWIEAGRVKIYNAGKGNSPHAHLIENCPAAVRGYWPSILGIHSFLELVPFMIIGELDGNRFVRVTEDVVMDDGEVLQLVWFGRAVLPTHAEKDTTPIVICHHGAMCCSHDLPGQGYIHAGLDKGWLVCALNRRGHTPHLRRSTCGLTRPKWHFFGSTADVREIISHIRRTYRPVANVYLIGLSSGSGLVAKCVGEQGQLRIPAGDPSYINGCVGVAPGYNIEICMKRMQWPYQQILLGRAKAFFLARNESVLKDVPHFQDMMATNCLQEFIDLSYAMGGYTSRDDMYQKINPMNTLKFVDVPSLFINAENDPICIRQNVLEYLHEFETSVGATLALTKTGSHLPFYEFFSSWWNPFRFDCWSDRLAYEWISAVEADVLLNQTKATEERALTPDKLPITRSTVKATPDSKQSTPGPWSAVKSPA